MTTFAITALVATLFAMGSPPPQLKSNLPRSHQCTIVESVSPSEVLVHATGIGRWEKGTVSNYDRETYLLHDAEDDARRAAVWFILYEGTEPILPTEKEKRMFQPIREMFFQIENIERFITWESGEPIKRVKRVVEKRRRYELILEKAMRVDKQAIRNALVDQGILLARGELATKIGMPLIMVIPACPKGQSPLELLAADPNLAHAAKVIEAFLTAHRYEVLVPEQADFITRQVEDQLAFHDREKDYSYRLALSVGSDVYIAFEVIISGERHSTKKASVNIRAFETTTARLIGAETGYSAAAKSAEPVLIEQAVNDAVDKVLSRINAYWLSDLERGIQYKLVVNLPSDIRSDRAEDLALAFSDIIQGAVAKEGRFKENIVSDRTLDYLVWCDPAMFSRSMQVYRAVKDAFSVRFSVYNLRKVTINRKLIVMAVEPAE